MLCDLRARAEQPKFADSARDGNCGQICVMGRAEVWKPEVPRDQRFGFDKLSVWVWRSSLDRYIRAHPSTLLPLGFRSGGVKGAASSGPLSLKEKTKGRGEHGWWTETTNEQVGWGGPTSARPRPETELVRMWEDSLRCHGSPTTRKRRAAEKRGGPSLGAGGETLTTAFKQRGRNKERDKDTRK